MAQINELNPRAAIQLASKMRNQMRNAAMERATLFSHLGRIGGVAIGSWGLGWWMGGLEYEYQQNKAAIDAGEMDDPRQFMGMIDYEILIGIVATGLGLLGQGVIGDSKNAVAKFLGAGAAVLEGVGLGAGAGYLYSIGQDAGQSSAAALPEAA